MIFCVFVLSLCLFSNAHPKHVKDGLSEKKHETGEGHEHNPEYDHEAFLGQDEAKVFDHLSPEESKEKLGDLFHKVDEQGIADGFVTQAELEKWIEFTQRRYIREESDRHMQQNDLDGDGLVSWDEYKNTTYGFLEENDSEGKHYAATLARDEQRFKVADRENDLKLSLDEFDAFLHPEKHDYMKGLVVSETIHDMDKNKDGLISMDEYIGDSWPEEDRVKGVEPEWVKGEREQFTDLRDTNKDGKMDREEVKNWILPQEHDQISAEAKHLISESDLDGDGQISKEEMVEKYDVFVGSEATDYGQLVHTKDEL